MKKIMEISKKISHTVPYRVLHERSAKQYQQIVLAKIRKNFMSSWLPSLKLKGLLAPKIFKFRKNLYVNLRLLKDYGLILSIMTNKKAYVCICFIFKIGGAASTRIYFPILVHALKCMNRRAYVCV